jgi:single-strand DNA-binding protein
MAGVNKVTLVGNLGKDPEVKHLDNGRAVATFSMATSESYKNKEGEKITNTEWHNVVLWSPIAEIAEKYLKKGNQTYIEGKLTTRRWEDKNGEIRYTTEVLARNLTLLGNANSGGSAARAPEHTEDDAPAFNPESDSDDLPF